MSIRRVTVRGSILAIDDEQFIGDEREERTIFGEVLLPTNRDRAELLRVHLKVGGEVRAELELFAAVDPFSRAEIDGIAKLYEGASTNTNDLDDSEVVALSVAPSAEVSHEINLKNRENSGGDIAIYKLRFTNFAVDLFSDLPRQDSWRWCARCNGLWFGGGGGHGVCPAAGPHSSSGSGNYALVQNTSFPGGQSDWRWCKRCLGLWFAGSGGAGACPAGGGHSSAGSGDYVVTELADAPGQRGWRWCHRCLGMFFGLQSTPGSCPVGGQHNSAGSGDYVLMHL